MQDGEGFITISRLGQLCLLALVQSTANFSSQFMKIWINDIPAL